MNRKITHDDSSEIEKQLLIHSGFKITPSRVAILSLLKETPHPISAQEITDRITEGTSERVTVYRIIQSFIEAGLVREVNLRHGHIDYELAHEEDDHHHMVCVTCGCVEDFEECGADKIAKAVLKKSKLFASVHEHAIELFGICKTCAKKKKK